MRIALTLGVGIAVLLAIINCIRAQTGENCQLKDGRRCQQDCFTNAKNLTRCKCDYGFELQADDISCRPILEVESSFPTIGPESGGTLITIKGRNLMRDPYAKVFFGTDIVCEIMPNSTNSTLYIHAANIYSIRSLPYQEFNITVEHSSSGLRSQSPNGFTYRPDPVVTSIEPTTSVLSGGIRLTVSGQNMMSVAEPKFNIYVFEENKYLKTFTTACILHSNTTFYCASPDVSGLSGKLQYVIGLFLDGVIKFDYQGANIVKSPIYTDRCVSYEQTTLPPIYPSRQYPNTGAPGPPCWPGLPGPPGPAGPPGWSGDDCNPPEGPKGPQTTYHYNTQGRYPPTKPTTQISTSWYPPVCPICANFIIYPDPTIHLLEPEEMRFRPFSPFNHKFITIKGEDLDRGLQKNDYSIFIGNSQCKELDLSYNQLVCQVPGSNQLKEGASADNHIIVQIGVSKSNRFYVGKFIYEETLWHYKPARIGFIALIVIIPCIVLVYLIIKLVKKRKRERRKNKFITAALRKEHKKSNGMEKHYLHPVKTRAETPIDSPADFKDNYLQPVKTENGEKDDKTPVDCPADFKENYLRPVKTDNGEKFEETTNEAHDYQNQPPNNNDMSQNHLQILP